MFSGVASSSFYRPLFIRWSEARDRDGEGGGSCVWYCCVSNHGESLEGGGGEWGYAGQEERRKREGGEEGGERI